MEIKEVKFGKEVQDGLLKGAETVYKAVSSTMGAKGRYAAIYDRLKPNNVTKDGHYTAKSIFLKDEAENMGAQMIKEVAQKSATEAGDGTTTSTVLAYNIYKWASEAINEGHAAIDVKKGVQLAVKETVKKIQEQAIHIKDDMEMLKQVATISANNDESIGSLIMEAYSKIGEEGIVKKMVSSGSESYVESTDGVKINSGYLSPYFVTDPERMYCDLSKTFICIYNGNVGTFAEIQNMMEFMAENNGENSLLFIAMNIEQEALSTLITNKVKGGFKVCAISAPGIGKTRGTWLEDIAASTGAIIINDGAGESIKDNFHPDKLGTAEGVRITETDCEIIKGGKDPEEFEMRVANIKHLIETEEHPASVEFNKGRLACIAGGVSVVHVGATTAMEKQEKEDLVEDAIAAAKSALEEGIIAGGGTTLFNISKEIVNLKGENEAQDAGIEIVSKALKMPLKTIINNAGLDVNKITEEIELNGTDSKVGYNLNTDKFEDMIEAGILDTAKVARMAIENSSSVAAVMLMTDTLIYPINQE